MYQQARTNDWSGRHDAKPSDYIFQTVKLIEPQTISAPGIALLGFECDEGIARNQGRTGAKMGPEAFRQCFGKLAHHFTQPLYDCGNIVCDNNLETAQTLLGETVHTILQKNCLPVVIGGGHETAWGHYQGLAKQNLNSLAIINIDAHFDLRNGPSSSGTPFREIAEHRQTQGLPFNYLCLGIQQQANTAELFNRAKKLGVHTVYANQIHQGFNLVEKIKSFTADIEHIYLTICLDAFAASVAPGVSAPQPLGLFPAQIIPLLHYLSSTKKIIALDIVELSPPHDIDNHTAKLAANLIYEYLKGSDTP